jgi:hypothetical protein
LGGDDIGELMLSVILVPFSGLVTVTMPVPALARLETTELAALARLDWLTVPTAIVLMFEIPVTAAVVTLMTPVVLPAQDVSAVPIRELVTLTEPEAVPVVAEAIEAVKLDGTNGMPVPWGTPGIVTLKSLDVVNMLNDGTAEAERLPAAEDTTELDSEVVILLEGVGVVLPRPELPVPREEVEKMVPFAEVGVVPVPTLAVAVALIEESDWGSKVHVPEVPVAVMMPAVLVP